MSIRLVSSWLYVIDLDWTRAVYISADKDVVFSLMLLIYKLRVNYHVTRLARTKLWHLLDLRQSLIVLLVRQGRWWPFLLLNANLLDDKRILIVLLVIHVHLHLFQQLVLAFQFLITRTKLLDQRTVILWILLQHAVFLFTLSHSTVVVANRWV